MRMCPARSLLRAGVALPLAALVACGGGGGRPQPAPAPPPILAPAPAPTPTPTPTPSSTDFGTAEYDRSSGLAVSNALPAYQSGATGAGILAGVIDSGVDVDSPEFAGKISPFSADLAGNRGLQDEGGHGTAVSSVLLGARNGLGTHGVAFDATLLVLRTDSPGTCADPGSGDDEGGCSHSDSVIARGVDLATAQGARVINISLGGSPMAFPLRGAIGRATAAGVVIVISAGNDGEANPDEFARIAADPSARGQVIIAGSVNSVGSISSFSNRAGSHANVYLSALGERVRAPGHEGTSFSWSGTSFAAPHIAGAVALLAQAFPNLSGAQIVDLLLRTATDAGAAGPDSIYGRGLLNIGRAFEPQGQSSLAGSAAKVSLDDNGTMSAPMGDAGGGQLGAVILDGYDRAFAVDLAGSIRSATPSMTLAGSLQNEQRNLAAARGGTMVALSIQPGDRTVSLDRLMLSRDEAERARAVAGMVSSRLGKNSSFAIGIAQSGTSLAAQLEGRSDPAFLIARDATGAVGFERRSDSAFAFRHQIGRLGLWATAEQGDALVYEHGFVSQLRGRYQRYGYSSVTAGFDRAFGNLRLAGSASHLIEGQTVLGARFGPAFGAGSARSWFVDVDASMALGGGWSIGGATRQGWTMVGAGGALGRSALLRTDSYAFDLARAGLFDPSDRLAFRVSQPLRVASGGFDLSLPTGYDYVSGVTAYSLQRLDLSPEGREIDFETSYARELWGGRMGAHLFYRNDPGNYEAMPDDVGAAVRFSLGF